MTVWDEAEETRRKDEALGDAAMELRDALEDLLDCVKKADAGDDSVWPHRDAAMETAEELLERLRNA